MTILRDFSDAELKKERYIIQKQVIGITFNVKSITIAHIGEANLNFKI